MTGVHTEYLTGDILTDDWLNACRSEQTRKIYSIRWRIWLQYCTAKKLPNSGTAIIEDIKQRRQSNDSAIKFFWDNEIPKYFKWLQEEYKNPKTKKAMSQSSALTVANVPRAFFAFHRYQLEIKANALPSSEKVQTTITDHAFDVYQLRAMFAQGDLQERTVLALGKDLALRVEDFSELNRHMIETLITRENEKAEAEKRPIDVIEFELVTTKEKESASCHLSHESIELLKEYLRTVPAKNGHLFALGTDGLNDVVKRLAEKSKITLTGRVRWHCLRKFFITVSHGLVTEPVMKYMVGKHISKDLKTYIQANSETMKAFKLIEPLISLTKTNGNGNTQLAKQLEEIKKNATKQLIMLKLMEKITPKEEMQKALVELSEELGIKLKPKPFVFGEHVETYMRYELPSIDEFITQLSEALDKKQLQKELKELGNGEQ